MENLAELPAKLLHSAPRDGAHQDMTETPQFTAFVAGIFAVNSIVKRLNWVSLQYSHVNY